jgi:hypothetical protein
MSAAFAGVSAVDVKSAHASAHARCKDLIDDFMVAPPAAGERSADFKAVQPVFYDCGLWTVNRA